MDDKAGGFLTVRVPILLEERLKALAIRRRKPVSEVIRESLELALDRECEAALMATNFEFILEHALEALFGLEDMVARVFDPEMAEKIDWEGQRKALLQISENALKNARIIMSGRVPGAE